MIFLLLSLLPFVVEVVKYKSFISNHFLISAETLSMIIFFIGIYKYYKSPKNWQNYIFLPLYFLSTWLHLKLKYSDSLYYPNYVYSRFGLDWGPLGHISQSLMICFGVTEYLKRYHAKVVSSLTVWFAEFNQGSRYKKTVVLLTLFVSAVWLNETNKILYDRQLDVTEYLFLNSDNLSKETYSRTKSVGNFYLEIKSLDSSLKPGYELIIPPQSDSWPYEGNMPLIRGIIYPNRLSRLTSRTPDRIPAYLLITCGYKVNNTGKCFPDDENIFAGAKNSLLIDSKGFISEVAAGSFSLIRNSDSLMFTSVD